MMTSSPIRNLNDADLLDSEGDLGNSIPISSETRGGTFTFSNNINGSFPPKAYAARARMAGRLNAANISDSEMNALLHERSILLDKKIDGSITKKEMNRLEYVRWSLDRIEDAHYGIYLDRLLEAVQMQEQLGAKIESLHQQLANLLSRRK